MENKYTIKCYHCGNEFSVDDLVGNTVCEHCKKSVEKEKAYKYLLSLSEIKSEEKTVAHGENYKKVEMILDRAEFYIENGDFDKAKAELDDAIKITNSNAMVWFAYVKIETKNLTDYDNKSYKEYLDRAMKCADEKQADLIKSQFAEFYRKSQLTVCEREEEFRAETDEDQNFLETELKDLMPEFATKQKRLNLNKILWIVGLILSVGLLSTYFLIKKDIFLIVSILPLILFYVFLRKWITDKDVTKIFNDLLDLYDAIESFDLNDASKKGLISKMCAVTLTIYENEPTVIINNKYYELAEYLADLNVDKIDEFIKSHKNMYNNI